MASLDNNLECQEDELLALGSIYDGRVFTRSENKMEGQVNVYLDLPNPFEVKSAVKRIPVGTDDSTSEGKNSVPQWEVFQVKHLPPLVLNFSLPPGYPSTEAPRFTLNCKWMTAIQVIHLPAVNYIR